MVVCGGVSQVCGLPVVLQRLAHVLLDAGPGLVHQTQVAHRIAVLVLRGLLKQPERPVHVLLHAVSGEQQRSHAGFGLGASQLDRFLQELLRLPLVGGHALPLVIEDGQPEDVIRLPSELHGLLDQCERALGILLDPVAFHVQVAQVEQPCGTVLLGGLAIQLERGGDVLFDAVPVLVHVAEDVLSHRMAHGGSLSEGDAGLLEVLGALGLQVLPVAFLEQIIGIGHRSRPIL